MSNFCSDRKANVVPFLSKLEKNCEANLESLIERARTLKLEGFENVNWLHTTWAITAGRLTKQTAKNSSKALINFNYSPKLGGEPIHAIWADLIKALFLLRFHRKNQALSNQRNFITAASYVIYEVAKINCRLAQLTPEYLDRASRRITADYERGTAYNLHKAVAEFAAYCDSNKLCKAQLNYHFSGMRRPENVGGLNHKRLDDPQVLETKNDKLVAPDVYQVIGELYQNVPKDHKYRFYVLVLTLLACLGRRFSEITLLPYQNLQYDDDGRAFLDYFPRKVSQGDVFTPKRRLYLPTSVIEIVDPVITEFNELCALARATAAQMQLTQGPDLTFLLDIEDEKRLYQDDLLAIGISPTTLDTTGWIRKNGYAIADKEKLTSQGRKPNYPFYYTNKAGVKAYCQRDYSEKYIAPIHIDQNNQKYYLKDLLMVRHLGLSSGTYSKWIATQCTHSMMTTFLRYLPELATSYTSSKINVDFTSHHFRHTFNTLLDEGGLSDLLQTEWFGRTNPRDTKAYQHTSREKRALMLREDIKKGQIGGLIAEQVKLLPVKVVDAYLKARVTAVHDVGTGICIHNFAQTPCERHLQCSADCKDYVWAKDDRGREEDLKRQYALTKITRETAEQKAQSDKPKKSIDWLKHNDKKLRTLTKQLADNGIKEFDPHQYLKGHSSD